MKHYKYNFYLHQLKSDTNLIWNVDQNACEYIKESTTYIDSNQYRYRRTVNIRLIDCQGKLIEEIIEEDAYVESILVTRLQKFIKNGTITKQIDLAYDYENRICTETTIKGQITTKNERKLAYIGDYNYSIDSYNFYYQNTIKAK